MFIIYICFQSSAVARRRVVNRKPLNSLTTCFLYGIGRVYLTDLTHSSLGLPGINGRVKIREYHGLDRSLAVFTLLKIWF